MSMGEIELRSIALEKQYMELVAAHKAVGMRGDTRRAIQLLERIQVSEREFNEINHTKKLFAGSTVSEPEEHKMTLVELMQMQVPAYIERNTLKLLSESMSRSELELMRRPDRRDYSQVWLEEDSRTSLTDWNAALRYRPDTVVQQREQAIERNNIRAAFIEWRRQAHTTLDSREVEERFMSEGGPPKGAANEVLLRALQFVLVATDFELDALPLDLRQACVDALSKLEE